MIIEEELTKEQRNHMDTWQPPRVRNGQQVQFYPQADINSKHPALGWVWSNKNMRALQIYVPMGIGGDIIKGPVRHIDDPKLELNDDQRAEGAWDFTEEDRIRKSELDAINERLEILEVALISGGGDRRFIISAAKRYGIEGQFQTMKTAKIRTLIQEKLVSAIPELVESAQDLEEEALPEPEPEPEMEFSHDAQRFKEVKPDESIQFEESEETEL